MSNTIATKLLLEENTGMVASSSDGLSGGLESSMFSEELRRMNDYDNNRCPEKWRKALQYIVVNGWHLAELMNLFGEREFVSPIEDITTMITTYNTVVKKNKELKSGSMSLHVGLERVNNRISNGGMELLLKQLRRNSNITVDIHRERYHEYKHPAVKMSDTIGGLSHLFVTLNCYSASKGTIYGIPLADDKVLYELGRVDISDLEPISERRFIYIFGTQPASDDIITQALVELNNLPEEKDGYDLKYSLKDVDFDTLETGKAIQARYDEALYAQAQGLFRDIRVCKLMVEKKRKVPVGDPVIIGVDPFGNQYPIVYWQGD